MNISWFENASFIVLKDHVVQRCRWLPVARQHFSFIFNLLQFAVAPYIYHCLYTYSRHEYTVEKSGFFPIELRCNASICVIRPRSEYQFNQLKVRKGLPWITVEKSCLKSGTLYLSFLYWLVLNTNLRSISAISWHM